MANKASFTPAAAGKIVQAVRKIEALTPVLRNRPEETTSSGSEVFVVRLTGEGPEYDGTEQRWNGTDWEPALQPLTWSASDIKGNIIDINGRKGLGGQLVLATIASDDDGDPVWVSYGTIDDIEMSFRGYIDDDDGLLYFYFGEVYIGEDAPVEVYDDGLGYDPGTDAIYYVEITSTMGSTTYTVNAVIQSALTVDKLITVSGSTVTMKVPIFLVEDLTGTFAQLYDGDIHIQSNFTPSFGADYRGAAENEGKFVGLKSYLSTVDDVNFDYFLLANEYREKYLAGGVVDHTEYAAFKFGGVTENSSFDIVDDIDTASADSITLVRKTVSYTTEAGLVEELSSAATTDVILTADKWISIEPGGNWIHNNSPVLSESDVEHWHKLTIPNVQIDDGTAASIDLYFDRTGHLWQINSETQPPPENNYKYRHCTDPTTYPDLVLGSQQANTVISVDGQCYEEVGSTDQDTTSPVPTVGATFSTCALCVAAPTGEQWKKCSDDTNAAVLSTTHTNVDYAWLCISSILLKCYNAATTAAAATDPTVLKQCDVSVPTACTDLVGWPVSDNFGGAGCNSGAIDDTNWGVRWSDDSSGGTLTLSGANLNTSTPAGQNTIATIALSHAGDFTVTVKSSHTTNQTGDNTRYADLRCQIGATTYDAVRDWDERNIGEGFYDEPGANTVSNTATTYWLRITRTGSTVLTQYSTNGTTFTTLGSYTNAGTLTSIRLITVKVLGNTTSQSWDFITGIDGTPADIIIDPTGRSCT